MKWKFGRKKKDECKKEECTCEHDYKEEQHQGSSDTRAMLEAQRMGRGSPGAPSHYLRKKSK